MFTISLLALKETERHLEPRQTALAGTGPATTKAAHKSVITIVRVVVLTQPRGILLTCHGVAAKQIFRALAATVSSTALPAGRAV
jgi:hypothetical protein